MDNKFITYLQGIEAKIAEVKTAVGSIDLSPITNKIGELANNFNSWKAPWTSARAGKLDKVDAIANDTHSVWNSIPSGTDSVAKQTTLNSVNSTLNSVNSSMAKDATVAKVSDLDNIYTGFPCDFDKSLIVKNISTKYGGTIIELQGKGAIHYCDIPNKSSIKSKIYIDGNLYKELNSISEGAGYNLKIRLISWKKAFLIPDGSTHYLKMLYPTDDETGITYKDFELIESSHICSKNKVSAIPLELKTNSYNVLSSEPFRFNKSFKIEVTSMGNAPYADYSVIYSLDE